MNRIRPISQIAAITLLASLPMAISGCGFIFSHAPPDGHEQMDYFSCTESNAGPIVDIIWGGLNVLGALAAASDPDSYENSGGVIFFGLSWGALSSAAAAVGFNKSKKCRAARQQLADRQTGAQRDTQAGDAVVQAVVVRPNAVTLAVGEQAQLVATALNSSGSTIPNMTFTWSSSNDAIASVNNAGGITAHAVGSVVIAANADNVVGTVNVEVRSQR